MSNHILFAVSSCDTLEKTLAQLGVELCRLIFIFEENGDKKVENNYKKSAAYQYFNNIFPLNPFFSFFPLAYCE